MTTPSTSATSAEQKLTNRLKELQESATVVSKLLLRSQRALYQYLAELYVWWREATAVPGYLQQQYKSAGIKYKQNTTTEINFSPLIRLTCGRENRPTDDSIWRWNATLNALHGIYEKEKQYQIDSVAKLQLYITIKGGVDAFLKGKPASNVTEIEDDTDLSDDEVDTKIVNQTKTQIAGGPNPLAPGVPASLLPSAPAITGGPPVPQASAAPQAQSAALAHRLEELYGTAQTFYSDATNISPVTFNYNVPTNQDGLGLILVRKIGATCHVVGASNEEVSIRTVTMGTYLEDYAALPQSVRAVIETVSTQCLPKRLKDFHDRLTDVSDQDISRGKLKAVRRLMYWHKRGQFILSPIRASSGVVTVATPKAPVFENATQDILLSTRARREIELHLIVEKDLNYFRPSNPTIIPEYRGSPNLACHAIRLQNLYQDADYFHLDFWPFYENMPEARTQLIASVPAHGFGAWSGQLTLDWFRKFALEFVAKWVNSHGTNITREHQKVLQFTFDSKALGVNFVYRDGRFDSTMTVDFSGTIAKSRSITVNVLSKDIVPSMQAVADLSIATAIDVEVDRDVIAMTFSTGAGKYEIYVPTCTIDGQRSTAHFSRYNVAAVPIDTFEDYYDPHEPQPVDEV